MIEIIGEDYHGCAGWINISADVIPLEFILLIWHSIIITLLPHKVKTQYVQI